MEDDVELAAAEDVQVAHVGANDLQRGPSLRRQSPHGRELRRADIDECRVGAELREENRVPPAATGERKHALPFERHAFQRSMRNAIEEAALARPISRRRALGTGVGNARSRETLPHALVVRADVVDRDATCHDAILAEPRVARRTYASGGP